METWYVLEDGDVVNPKDVAPDASGKLFHKSGVAVAMRGNVPHSRGVNVEEAQNRSREVKAATPKRYKNREIKSED